MKRIIGLLVLFMVAVFLLIGCSGGGGGIGTTANATPPTVLNAVVAKDVLINSTAGGPQSFPGFTGEKTVSGNMIWLTFNGKNWVFVGATMQVIER